MQMFTLALSLRLIHIVWAIDFLHLMRINDEWQNQ